MKPPRMRRPASQPIRQAIAIFRVFLLLGLVVAPAEVLAQKLCFRDLTGLPSTPNPAFPDGVVKNDPWWNNAFRYVFENGTNGPHAAVQGLRSSTHLFMSIEVNNDPTFDPLSDLIVLAFKGATDYRRIHLYAIPSAGVGNVSNNVLGNVKYYKGTGTADAVTWTLAGNNPAWIEAKLATSGAATALKSWNVELKIPLTTDPNANGLNLPTSGDFDFFFSILRVESGTSVAPFIWPPGTTIPDPWDAENATPAPKNWGKANLGGSGCGGVFFSVSDITTNNVPTSRINLNGPNIFSVNLHNSSVNNTGTPIPAQQVTASFKIANFGITDPDPSFGSWQLVPVGGNPTNPNSIPANGNTVFSTGSWTLNATQKAHYTSKPHQCIYVELDSSAAGTTNFINRSVYRNMDFGTASVFERVATIDTRGFEKRLANLGNVGASPPVFKVELVTAPTVRMQTLRPRDFEDGPIFREEMNMLYHAYVQTDRTIRVNQKTYKVKAPVGSYGYTVVHTLPKGALGTTTQVPKTPDFPSPRPADPTMLRPMSPEELALPAVEPFKPEELIPGEKWTLATTLVSASTPTTAPLQQPTFRTQALVAPGPEEQKSQQQSQGPSSQVITLEIPRDGVVQLATRAEYEEPPEETKPPEEPKPTPTDGCGCKRTGQTAGTTGLIGLFALGFFANRRRRDEHE
ncbi:hypothetical protein ATI61_11376 [Archangium gephyra]|uniref:Uncharacterized protein n=1 Tax=Archangium gephyra TaxID=48 RepID=A0AAC8Q888_9BACT|nr:hypothetical protein [Archangium gephyra]AKJ02887.1 Hypothetical protein AA314_04513 [Archangium gephyra]REG25013.1 hypothetical protein ATI61_11376 [Archangium gephyra]